MADDEWKEHLKKAFISISIVIITLGLLTVGLNMLLSGQLPEKVSNTIITIAIIIVAVAAVKLSNSILKLIDQYEGKDSPYREHRIELSYRFIQITVYLSAFILIFSTWGIDLSNVLLGAGLLGVIGGLAARQALSSVISGIIIMTTNMFKVGHWLNVEDKFGRVQKITFFNTHINSPQGEKHIIPNDSLTAKNVTNISERGKYRKDLLISIDYDSDISEALEICDETLSELESSDDRKHKAIIGHQRTSVKEFGDSGIQLAIKIWIDNPTPTIINETQTVVFNELHQNLRDSDIPIPFPQMTLSYREEEAPNEREP